LPRTVRIRLLWHKQAQFAGYLIAEQLGLARNRGVEIECQGIDFACGPIEAVLTGTAEMAVASPSHVLESRKPRDLSLVLAIQQQSPLVYPVRRDSGIATLADLAGRRVGVWPGGEDLELRFMLASAGLAPDAATRVPMNDTVPAFLEGRIDSAQMTAYHELHEVEAALGKDAITVLTAATLGCSLLKDGLVVSRTLIGEDPATVQAVVDAVLEGWTIAFDDPDRAVAACLVARPDIDEAHHRTQLADIRALSLVGAARVRGLGYPDPEHVARAAAAMAAVGEPVDAAVAAGVVDLSFWSAAPTEHRRSGWP
jgi:ABC-type nitrate/sulfonate/bicarbonate transport system substrate-binding protein